MSAWYKAERKKRPCSPSADNRGQHNKADKGMYITVDDLIVELIVEVLQQTSSLERDCRREHLVEVRAREEGLEMRMRNLPVIRKVGQVSLTNVDC